MLCEHNIWQVNKRLPIKRLVYLGFATSAQAVSDSTQVLL